MQHPTRYRRALTLSLVLVALGTVGAACSPEQVAFWHTAARQTSAQLISTGISNPIGDDVLARLRACESNGDYTAVSRSGAYRGAYQFSRRTWDNVAGTYAPMHVGADPASAPPQCRTTWPARSGPNRAPGPGRCAAAAPPEPRARFTLLPAVRESPHRGLPRRTGPCLVGAVRTSGSVLASTRRS